MKKLFTLRCLLAFVFTFLISQNSFSQNTIFSENMGVPTGTTSISTYATGNAPTTFQNKGVLTYSNGGVTNAADMRATSISSGYTGASGGGNVFFSSTNGTYGFSIESINSAAYNSLNVQFGYRKESATLLASFSVDYWDGVAWVTTANTAATLFNEAATAATGWYLSKQISLPIAAQIDGLKIRFVKSGTASIRVDDVKLTGIISTPTTTSISPSSANVGSPAFTLTVNGTNFLSGISNITFDGTIKTTTFVNSTQLTATISGADVGTSGNFPVGVTTTGAAAVSNTQIFTVNTVSGGTFTLTTPLPSFGNICINTTSATNSFTLDGNNLDGSAITVSGPAGYTFSESAGGTFNTTTPLTYTGAAFTNKIIYVKLTPTAVQSYNGNIIVNGGSVSNYPVAATGAGVNDAPFVTSNAATNVGATTSTITGTINSIGCAPILTYGFEYSTSSGFPEGSGIQVLSSNLGGGIFSTTLSGLAPNTRYYYKAFAVNSIDTTYGAQLAFTNTALPVPMAAQPGLSFTETFADIANWSSFFITGIGANHFKGLGATGSGGIPNGTTLTASTFSFQNPNPGPPVTPSTGGGVHRGTDQVPPRESIVLLSTGSPDNTTSVAIDFYMDFTGVNAGTLSFDYAVVNNSTGNRNGSLRVYATVDGITFTEITFAGVLNFINNTPLSDSKSNIALPAIFNNSATARLRFYYHNGDAAVGAGSRPKISIDNLTVTALASTPCTPPTAPATSLVFGTITDTTIAASFTAANPATDSYLIVMSTASSLISNPVNNQNYAVGDNVGDGTVIAKIVGTSFIATNLNPLTTYYFFVFPMNAICTGGPLYYTTTVLNGNATTIAGLPPCAAPTNQPTNLIFGTSTSNSIEGSFTATTADQYLVVRSLSTSLGADPVNTTLYNTGDALGNGKVVQRSIATTFTASGLAPNTPYNFFVFSLNNLGCVNGPAYNITNPLVGGQSTIPLPLCVTPANQPSNLNLTSSNTQISGTFTGTSGADDYLVIRSINSTLNATPSDNIDYAVGDIFGNGTVVSNNGNTSFLSTNLTSGTLYYFYIFAANKTCSGGTKYATQSPLQNNKQTTSSPSNNFYFGSLHSHSDYSDGNADNPGFIPTQNYDYAKNSLCMDYLGISEHNHFSSVNNPGNQVANYHLGSIQANNFTTANPNFLAMYGMEWGVISGGGHVVIYGDGMDDLWGWESGSGAWGPTNNYDVFVPKSVYRGTTGLFKTINDNIGTKTFATLAHPSLGDYNKLDTSYDATADNAIVGTAVESGPAFSTNTTYSNPGSSLSYLYYYKLMLAKGYRLGPSIDHDNHNTTFGRTTTSRTAVIAPVLTKTAFVNAMRNMNFYATQDCDTKIDFTVNTKMMGSTFTDRSVPNIYVSLTDATTSLSSAIIRLMYGTPGNNLNAVQIDSSIGDKLQFTHAALTDLSTGYYYIEVANGTSRVVTSPIWYTRNDATVLPVKLSVFSVQKAGKSAQLDWTTEQETNSSHFIVQRSADGRTWNGISSVNAAGNSSTRKEYRSYDNAPLNGINYYRLKQFDVDGKFEYSSVKSLQFSIAYSISVAPNPAREFINISSVKNQNSVLSIQLVDVSGKILRTIQSSQSLIKINTTGIAKGLYFIKVKDENTVQTQRVIIE